MVIWQIAQYHYNFGMKQKLGEDIIKMYEPYKNDKAKWKLSEINNQKFEIYDRY